MLRVSCACCGRAKVTTNLRDSVFNPLFIRMVVSRECSVHPKEPHWSLLIYFIATPCGVVWPQCRETRTNPSRAIVKRFRGDTRMGVIKCERESDQHLLGIIESSIGANGNGLFRLPLQQHTDTLRTFFSIVRVDDNRRNKRSIPTCKQQRAA